MALTWGQYLCRGVQVTLVEENGLSVSSGDRAKVVLQKLQSVLCREGLTPFSATIAVGHIKSKLDRGESDQLTHALAYLVNLIRGSPSIDPLRSGCPQIIPSLRSFPVWDCALFPWVRELEGATDGIRAELLALRSAPQGGCFQQYSENATSSGQWNVCYLHLHSLDYSLNRQFCPITTASIEKVPRHYHHAFFSAVAPNTHISAHYGPTNKKLRCFLPLCVPPEGEGESFLVVSGQKVPLIEGQAVIFDDSFKHEAFNTSSSHPRIALIFDFWHPDLTDSEVKIFEFLTNAQIRAAQRLYDGQPKEQTPAVGDDFLSAILRSKAAGLTEQHCRNIWGDYH